MRGRKTQSLTKHKRTVAYIRVSTDEQAQSGASLSAQRSRIEAFAIATERQLDETIVDAGESGKTLKRSGVAKVLAGVQDGTIGTVIVLKLDRLTRSVRDLGELLDLFAKNGAAIVSVGESLDTSSAAGRLVTNMLGVVAQWEREAIAERTSAALGERRKERRAYSRVPFGFCLEGNKLVQDPKQQRGLQIIRKMVEEEASLRQIAQRLTDAGISPARGGTWFASSIKSILDSRMFAEAGSLHTGG